MSEYSVKLVGAMVHEDAPGAPLAAARPSVQVKGRSR